MTRATHSIFQTLEPLHSPDNLDKKKERASYARSRLTASGAMLGRGESASESAQQGFALLAVAIALAVIALIVAVVARSAQSFVGRTASDYGNLQMRAALDAGAVIAARTLTTSSASPNIALAESVTIGGVTVKITIRPESSKINLSEANPKLIAALLRTSDISAAGSDRIAREIIAWRDRSQDVGRIEVAGVQGVVFGGFRSTSRFETISELLRIPDGNQDLVNCLEPDITLYSGRSGVNLINASERVRRAALLADAAQGTLLAPSMAPAVSAALAAAGDVFEITILAKARERESTRQVIIRVTGNRRDPYWTIRQVSPAPSARAANAACRRYKGTHGNF